MSYRKDEADAPALFVWRYFSADTPDACAARDAVLAHIDRSARLLDGAEERARDLREALEGAKQTPEVRAVLREDAIRRAALYPHICAHPDEGGAI
jgi:hypothetical protein